MSYVLIVSRQHKHWRKIALWILIAAVFVSIPLVYGYAVEYWTSIELYRRYLQLGVWGMKILGAFAIGGLVLQKHNPDLPMVRFFRVTLICVLIVVGCFVRSATLAL